MHDDFDKVLDFKVEHQTVLHLHLSSIVEAVSSRHSLGRLCPMNQLNDVQNNPQQLHGDQRQNKFLSSY